MGISIDALQKRFRDYGIAKGRRWRDFEDQTAEDILSKRQAREGMAS